MNAGLRHVDPDDRRIGDGDEGTHLGAGLHAADLLAADPSRRREALRAARGRRTLDPHRPVVVRAVMADAPLAHRRRFAHALAVSGRAHTLVVDDGGGFVLLTSPRRTSTDVDAWVRGTAAGTGVAVAASIGSAELRPDDDDPRPAADGARAASELLQLVGRDALGTARAEELGLWRLAHAMAGSADLAAAASPAADELWRSTDRMRRDTVEAYLDAGCRVAVACRALFIHRTTLYYRLESMPDSVRAALSDGAQRSALHLGLKVLRLRAAAARGDDEPPASSPAEGTATITALRPHRAAALAAHPASGGSRA